MIPVMVRPAEDELFTAWIETVAELNGLPVGRFYEDYFGVRHGRKLRYKSIYPVGLEMACRMHQDTAFFPDLDEALKKHTDLYASLPMMPVGMSAKYFEAVLRSDTRKAARPKQEGILEYRTCPECREEDLAQRRRTVIHVPHQLSGVEVCWKHGCVLERQGDAPVLRDMDMEQRIASYAAALYQKPCTACIDQTKSVIGEYLRDHGTNFRKVLADASSAGYLDAEQARVVDMEYRNAMRLRNRHLLRLLAYLYPDINELRGRLEGHGGISCRDTEEFDCIGTCGVLGEYRCRRCGEIFHMHPRAVQAGVPCPCCGSGRTEDEQMSVYLEFYQNGEYELADDKRMLRHKPCGSEKRMKPSFWFLDAEECQYCQSRTIGKWQQALDADMEEYLVTDVSAIQEKGVRRITVRHKRCGNTFGVQGYDYYFQGNTELVECPYCRKRFVKSIKSKQRLGLYRRAVNGMGMTVVAYHGSRNMTVRLDNGIERRMSWETFTGGAKNVPEIHIGEEMTNSQGLHCRIVRYANSSDLTVRFDDGTEVDCLYRYFKQGCVRCRK